MKGETPKIPKRRGPKNRLHAKYKKISHADRIKIIYLKQVHQQSLNDIAIEMDVKYNSIRNILKAFSQSGRTSKKTYKKTAPRHSRGDLTTEGVTHVDSVSEESSISHGCPDLHSRGFGAQGAKITISLDDPSQDVKGQLAGSVEVQARAPVNESWQQLGFRSPRHKSSQTMNAAKYVKKLNNGEPTQIDFSSSLLRLTAGPHPSTPLEVGASFSGVLDRLHLRPGGLNEDEEGGWKFSHGEVEEYQSCTAYINTFTGSLSYLNNYTNQAKRKALLGYYEEGQKEQAERLLKTLPFAKKKI